MTKKKAKIKTKKKAIRTRAPLPASSQTFSPLITPPPVVTPHPAAGKVVKEFEDQLDARLSGEPPPAPKRGPGRPPNKKPEPEPEPAELTIDIVAGVVKIPFELWAISQSVKSLSLTDSEARNIAEPAHSLLEHYLPQIPVIAYAWVSMSVSVFWVMQSRLLTIKEIHLHQKETEPARPAEPSGTGVVTKFPTKSEPVKV